MDTTEIIMILCAASRGRLPSIFNGQVTREICKITGVPSSRCDPAARPPVRPDGALVSRHGGQYFHFVEMGNWFTGSGGTGNAITDHDRAILDLKSQRDRLELYVKKVRVQSLFFNRPAEILVADTS